MILKIRDDTEDIAEFCRSHHVKRVEVFGSAIQFYLEPAYGYVKPAPHDRDLNEIIRDVKDEKALPKSSAATKTSTEFPTFNDKNRTRLR